MTASGPVARRSAAWKGSWVHAMGVLTADDGAWVVALSQDDFGSMSGLTEPLTAFLPVPNVGPIAFQHGRV